MSSTSNIRQITISEIRTKTDYSVVRARVDKDGALVLEGHDLGQGPKKFWGGCEYEYWRTVAPEDVPAVLLWLIKERFSSDSEFEEWLNTKRIPSKFQNWT